ncbi:MAG: DoxX family protein [Colwellia sp.]|nr:DoxX family protein [Colwellia sp.]
MNIKWFKTSPSQTVRSIELIRIVIALIIVMHPMHGFFNMDNIPRFGDFIESHGFPFGLFLAWSVLIIQFTCSVALVFRRFVVFACIGHIFILIMGIWLSHIPHGWYVVGPGSGGMEFSVLMITCLLATLLAYWPVVTEKIKES